MGIEIWNGNSNMEWELKYEMGIGIWEENFFMERKRQL